MQNKPRMSARQDIRFRPNKRRLRNRSIIRIRIQLRLRTRIPPVISTNLPELGAKEIRLGDAEEGQCCYGAGELDHHQGNENSRPLPPPGDHDAWEFEHFVVLYRIVTWDLLERRMR